MFARPFRSRFGRWLARGSASLLSIGSFEPSLQSEEKKLLITNGHQIDRRVEGKGSPVLAGSMYDFKVKISGAEKKCFPVIVRARCNEVALRMKCNVPHPSFVFDLAIRLPRLRTDYADLPLEITLLCEYIPGTGCDAVA